MSNFDRRGFPGYESSIECGPEVVNGTGQVSLAFWDRDGHEEPETQCVMFLMNADEVLKLADWLAACAWEAKREQWREGHLFNG